VLTGGDPLKRPDVFAIVEAAVVRWQLLLAIGLVFWLFLMFPGLRPAMRRPGDGDLASLFLYERRAWGVRTADGQAPGHDDPGCRGHRYREAQLPAVS